MNLIERRYWIFDMDGTLTVPAHDFDAIRQELGLPQGRPILEQLADLPAERSRALQRRLEAIELEIARDAVRQPGSEELLTALLERGATVGILTRNSHRNAIETLRACGLAAFFDPDDVMSRESCAPKPSADGIQKLLSRWHATPEKTVMVGDFLFDILAGREAGTATVFVDNHGKEEYAQQADKSVRNLEELLANLSGGENQRTTL
jgi:HAD superfamily hydrolase (TIGR01509 family)